MAVSSTLGELFIDIKADTSKVGGAFAAVKSAAMGLGSSITAALGPVAAALAGAFAVKEMVSSFMEGELAATELSSALASNGQEVDNNMAKFQDLAKEIQAATRIGDEQTFGLITKGLNLGLPASEMATFAKSAIGLGTALKMGPEEAMQALAKESQGVKSTLDRQIPALKGVTDQGERLAIISQFAAKGLSQEEAATATLSGQMTQLWNAVGDLAETLGGFLAPVIGFGVQLLKDLTAILQTTADAFTGMSADTAALGEYLRGVLLQNIKLIAWVLQSLGPIVVKVASTVIGWFNSIAVYWLDLANKVATYGMRIPEVWQTILDAAGRILTAVGDWFGWLGGIIGEWTGSAVSSVGDFVETLAFTMLNVDLIVQEAGIVFADWGAAVSDTFTWLAGVVTSFVDFFISNFGNIWRTQLDNALTVLINFGESARNIWASVVEYFRTGKVTMPEIKILEGVKNPYAGFKPPEFKDSFDKDEARAGLDETWAARRKEWDAITKQDPLKDPLNAGNIPIVKAAEEEKKKKDKAQSSVGTFSGLGEAFKKANSAALKAEERKRQEALTLQKKAIAEAEKTNKILEEKLAVGLA